MRQPNSRKNESGTRFDPESLQGHVTPGALRYLTHAISPGAVVANRAEIEFSGWVRLKPNGPRLPFRATESIRAGHSFQVSALARRGLLSAKVEDSYENARGYSRVRALGLIPLRARRDANTARSARGRLVVESTWLPSAFLPAQGTQWSESPDLEHLTVPIDGEDIQADLRIGVDGEMAELSMERWSNLTPHGNFGWVPFTARSTAERTFSGYTIPSDITASWGTGTEREFEFFHAVVENAQFMS